MTEWTFQGAAKRLDDIDIPKIGSIIGVGEDEIHAFMDVESSGSGFDSHGRPKMLFEPHVFWRNLPKDKREIAQRDGLAYPKWRPGAYPKDSYPRLIKAMEIDQTAALKSASWGLGQIMGGNHLLAGYEAAQEMVQAFMEDEEAHLRAMIQFLVGSGLDDDLKHHRWQALARGYNGPGYAANQYDKKLAAAYRKWAKIPDTTWGGDDETDVVPVENEPAMPQTAAYTPPAATTLYTPPKLHPVPEGKWAEHTLEKYEVEAVQKRFREMGYFLVGKVDGGWGPSTRAAVTALQTQVHDGTAFKAADPTVVIDGHWGPQTKKLLSDSTNKRFISEARASTTVDDLRQQGSSQIRGADQIDVASKTVGGIGVSGLLASVMEYFGDLRSMLSGLPPWVWAVVIGLVALSLIALSVYLKRRADQIKKNRVNAERSGLHNGEPDPAPSPPVTQTPEPNQGLGKVSGGSFFPSFGRS